MRFFLLLQTTNPITQLIFLLRFTNTMIPLVIAIPVAPTIVTRLEMLFSGIIAVNNSKFTCGNFRWFSRLNK